jgi:glycerol-3-phosphate acyltransferase PlsX
VIIAVDAMGGDNAPAEVIRGCVQFLNEFGKSGNIRLKLFGQTEKIQSELNKHTFDKNCIEICEAPEIIEMAEHPTEAIKRKKNSSIVLGLNSLKRGDAGAFVSAGSTGALLTGATVIVGRIKGVERPALGTLLPCKTGSFFLIDSGANVDAKPQYLAQFAKIGSVYSKEVLGIENPRVGIVNIGAESEKGNVLTKEAFPLLESCGVNFVGSAEARDIPLGGFDVVVCDAFVGNIILKYSEGFSKALFSLIKHELTSAFLPSVGALLSKSAFKSLKKKLDPSEVGGAPFLGLKALVVKAHGSSDAKAIKNALRQCNIFIEKNVTAKMAESFAANGGV